MKPIAYVTGMLAGHVVVKPTDPTKVLQAGLALYAGIPKPLTTTQKIYLEVLSEPHSLRQLAKRFNCTTEGARKHVKALVNQRLVTSAIMFKHEKGRKGAWAKYYRSIK